VCLNCLLAELASDYEQFDKRALVIEPAANLPCYVSSPSSRWRDNKLKTDARDLLSQMQSFL